MALSDRFYAAICIGKEGLDDARQFYQSIRDFDHTSDGW